MIYYYLIGHRMSRLGLLTITDNAPPLSPPLEKTVHPLFCDDIAIFDWLQTTADIPTPTLHCPFCQRTKKHALTPTTGAWKIIHTDEHLSDDADCQISNDYAINTIGAIIVSIKCLWNHILFSRIIVHEK